MAKDVVIVTGSCGRIGAEVVKRLGENYSIVGFELLKALYASANEELVPVDISSDESVQQAFMHIRNFYGKKIASVIHLAAYYSFKEKHSDKYESITVKGTQRLLKALQEFDVEQFIFTSTMLVHAPTRPGEPITEESLVVPNWDYPLSKVRTEKVIHDMRGKIPVVILRVAGVYDDLCHSIPISNQIQRIYEKRLESRLFAGNLSHGSSFVHMADLVNSIVTAVEKRKTLPPELTLLIGEPKTMSYDAMQRRISSLLFHKEFRTWRVPKWIAKIGAWLENHIPFHQKSFIQPWMIALADDHYELDIERAKKILGWVPRHQIYDSLEVMIEALKKDPIAWYKKNQLQMPHHLRVKLAPK